MTTITLRKSASIREEIAKKVSQLRSEIETTISFPVWWGNSENTDYNKLIQNQKEKNAKMFDSINELQSVYLSLRKMIGDANHDEHIDDLLAERSVFLSEISFFKQFIGKCDPTSMSNTDISSLLDYKKNLKDNYRNSDYEVIGVYNEQDIDNFKQQLLEFQSSLQNANDSILTKNLLPRVKLTADQILILRNNGIML